MTPLLLDKLKDLPADEWAEMDAFIAANGEAYVLANWNLLVEQLDYIATL
jgi:hypothetical protein